MQHSDSQEKPFFWIYNSNKNTTNIFINIYDNIGYLNKYPKIYMNINIYMTFEYVFEYWFLNIRFFWRKNIQNFDEYLRHSWIAMIFKGSDPQME